MNPLEVRRIVLDVLSEATHRLYSRADRHQNITVRDFAEVVAELRERLPKALPPVVEDA